MANEPNDQESMMGHMLKSSFQRAALMGLLAAILMDDNETSLIEVKTKIASTMARLIDMDLMTGDQVEIEVLKVCKTFVKGEVAVQEANDILGDLK